MLTVRLGFALLAATYALSSGAELNYNQQSIKALSRAYGFLLGQDYSLERIESTYPGLRLQVESARLEFGASFGGVKEKFERELTQAMGEPNFQRIRQDLKQKLVELLGQQPMTADAASQFLGQVKARAKGNEIEPEVLTYLLAVNYSQAPVSEFLNGFRQRFNTDGRGKAQGIKLTLQLPRSWLAQEAERPHLVQKWTNEGGTGLSLIMLDIRDAEGYEPTAKEMDDFVKSGEARQALAEVGKVHDVGTFSLERRSGYWADLSMNQERAGIRIYQRGMQYQLFFRGKAIGIMCFAGAPATQPHKGNAAATLLKPLCQQVVNSMVLEQLY